MANVIKKATNKFTKGLVMDFSPENTKSEVLTNALNATLLTFNGNELSLQNDMGNARVESAFLPEGYIPVGTCEYGGIIYIVSYNPLEDKSQIGCFPSPERNISRKEMGRSDDVSVSYTDFQELNSWGMPNGNLTNVTRKILLKDSNLNPGDKFIVYSDETIYDERIQDLCWLNGDDFIQVDNPMVSLNLVSIQDNGRIVYLNSDVKKYEVNYSGKTFKHHILGQTVDQDSGKKIDVDSYRNVLSSGYSVFKEKTSGKLALLVELVTIDSFSLTHSIERVGENTINGVDCYTFNVTAHPEVSPEINKDNYNTSPKLKFYSFDNIRGNVQCIQNGEFKQLNYNYLFHNLDSVYLFKKDASERTYIFTGNNIDTYRSLLNTSLGDLSWNFTWSGTKIKLVPSETSEGDYFKMNKDSIYVLTKEQVKGYPFPGLLFAIDINSNGEYQIGAQIRGNQIDKYDYIAVKAGNTEIQSLRLNDKVSITPELNYFQGLGNKKIEEESPFELYKSEYLPDKETGVYDDIHLATFNLPKLLVDNNVNIPFKYDYTVTPCMEYGKLDFLSVSNTVDLNNLYNFDASNFTTWKYRIDGDQLMLTVGADIFDTFETDKVDGLFFEFYDWRGFAGSLEIIGKKSYSGKFTKILSLNNANTLSKNKLEYDSETKEFSLSNSFVRNVNILKNSGNSEGVVKHGAYYYNNNAVTYLNDTTGWCDAVKDDNGNYMFNPNTEKFEEITETNPNVHNWDTYRLQPFTGDNDCGVLYSNLIYGVKPYLRKTVNGKHMYIKKNDMFLFTMPLYNDYFYNTANFNTIANPKLNLVLTYKLQDESSITPYSSGSIIDGYLQDDYTQIIQPYLLGKWPDNSKQFNVTRYFKYSGRTKLNLEIGLLKDYEQYNLSCDPNINNAFSGNLRLISDNDSEKAFQVYSNTSGDVLNHGNNIPESDHYIRFEADTTPTVKPINYATLQEYNFIQNEGTKCIDINYQFIVGHDINVNNIALGEVPATTVCALYHHNGDNVYNNDDFGVHVIKNNDYDVLAPSIMYYNSGTAETEIFGLCKMVDISGTTISDQCTDVIQNSKVALPVTIGGKLNTGTPLRAVVDQIGKLQFCQPHVHGLHASYITNITPTDGGKFVSDSLNKNYHSDINIYNMCANTQRCINNNTEFISVVTGANLGGKTRFTGLQGYELAKFTRCMLETMKGVYAYNPDYDQVKVNKGDVYVADKQLQMISNLVCQNARINRIVFTDYLFIGSIKMCDYLTDLQTNSEITVASDLENHVWIPALDFQPDLTYVGSPNDYLISTLTYNLNIPQKLYDDLELDFSKNVVVKHANGDHDFLSGEINKKSLYGWYQPANKLVELDVCNYHIDQNTGSLEVLRNGKYEVYEETLVITPTQEEIDYLYGSASGGTRSLNITRPLSNGESVTINLSITTPQYFDKLGIEKSWDQRYDYEDKEVMWYYAHWILNPANENYSDVEINYYVSAYPTNTNMSVTVNKIDATIEGRSLLQNNLGSMDNSSSLYPYLKLSSFKGITQYRSYQYLKGQSHAYHYRDIFNDKETVGSTVDYLPLIVNINNVEYELVVGYLQWGDYESETTTSPYRLYVELAEQSQHFVVRCKIPTITCTVQVFKTLDDYSDSILHFPKYNNYGYYDTNGRYSVSTLVEYKDPKLVGSTITLNDLQYIPESSGHRLFMRSDVFEPKNGNSVVYRLNSDTSMGDTNCNALRLFSGPCYHTSVAVNSNEPEYIQND